MSKRYLISAVFLGLVIGLSLQHPGRAEGPTNLQDVKIEVPFPPFMIATEADKATDPNKACKQGEDDRGSDLCAQWKAADAAKNSADWTRRTFFLGVVGTVIGFLTLVAAGAAAFYARAAADHTKRGADAAQSSVDEARKTNLIASETAKIEQRPWVKLTVQLSPRFNDGKDKDSFVGTLHVGISNIGATPALDIYYICDISLLNTFDKLELLHQKTVEKINQFNTSPRMHAGEIVFPSDKIVRNLGVAIWRKELNESETLMKDRLVVPWLYISVIYRDRHRDRWFRTGMIYDVMRRHEDGTATPIRSENLELTGIDMIAVASGRGLID